jgi:hypothetical protein
LINVEPFAPFSSQDGFKATGVAIKDGGSLKDVWTAARAKGGPNSMRAHKEEVMRSRPAQTLCMDHAFEVAKRVRNADGSQAFVGIFSVMNKRVTITAQRFVKSKSMDEVVPMLEEWRDNQLQ